MTRRIFLDTEWTAPPWSEGSELTPDEPRLAREALAAAVIDFCGRVDEFWAWIPTLKSFREWSGLGEEAAEVYARCRDVDLQMVRSLVQPWPQGGGRGSTQGGEPPAPPRPCRMESGTVQPHPCEALAAVRFVQNGTGG